MSEPWRELARMCEQNAADSANQFTRIIIQSLIFAVLCGIAAAYSDWPEGLLWIVLSLCMLTLAYVAKRLGDYFIQQQLKYRQEAMDGERKYSP